MLDQTISAAGDTGRAAAWVGDRFAIVALAAADGSVRSTQIDAEPDRTAYLARIVHRIGPRELVLVAGAEGLRVEFERLYVSVHHRPDVLVDIDALSELTAAALGARLRAAA